MSLTNFQILRFLLATSWNFSIYYNIMFVGDECDRLEDTHLRTYKIISLLCDYNLLHFCRYRLWGPLKITFPSEQ